MPKRRSAATAFAAAALAFGSGGAAAQVSQSSPAPGWSFNLTPYLWLPLITGTLNFYLPAGVSGAASTDLKPGTYLGGLNFAGMAMGEARYDRFSVLTDILYVNFSLSSSRLRSGDFAAIPRNPLGAATDINVSTRVGAGVWGLAGGYTVLNGEWGSLDLIGGFRLLFINSTLNHTSSITFDGPRGGTATVLGPSGSLSLTKNLWNGIGGVRGKINIPNSAFYIPFYGDVGAGASNVTWQVSSGVGYRTSWADLALGWRYLTFDQSNNRAVKTLSLNGPYLSASFKF